MNQKLNYIGLCRLLICLTCSAPAQGTFYNSDFEFAWPGPGLPGAYNVSVLIPGWSILIDGRIADSTVYYERPPPAYRPSAVLVHSDWGSALDGNLSVLLYGGYLDVPQKSDPPPDAVRVETMVWASAAIPSDAQSLQFKLANYQDNFRVQVGNQTLVPIPLQDEGNYIVYGVEVGQFAGSVQMLGVGTKGVAVVDSFMFSPQPVPEPNTFYFSLFAGFLLIVRRFTTRSAFIGNLREVVPGRQEV